MYIRAHLFIYAPTHIYRCVGAMCHTKKITAVEISANILAQMRKKCAPEISDSQKEISNFVARNGGKMRPNFWAVFNSVYSLTHDVMVCVGTDKKVSVLEVRRNRNFADHVGELLKTHKVCRVFEGVALSVNWENWKSVYRSLMPRKDNQVYDYEPSEWEVEVREKERKREVMFYEQASNDRYKKMGKRGYNLSFNEMRAVRRMEAAERQACRTIRAARQIMEAI